MKINVLLLFGGRSSEHAVSLMSAATMNRGLNRSAYHVVKVYISPEGLWRYYEGPIEEIREEELIREGAECTLTVGSEKPVLLVFEQDGSVRRIPVDVALPALHGKNGEDGALQGLFEMARLPYVGCGVLSSASSMDKITTKRVVESVTRICQANYVAVMNYEMKKDPAKVMDRVEASLGYPVYVKPSNAGSSIGVSRAENREELKTALELALQCDSRILVEEEIRGREIECAVLGNPETVKASGVGEIMAADSFYTYDAKYNNPLSGTVLDPELPSQTVEEIRKDAVSIFRALSGSGLARVDFFVENGTGRVVFNEINTLPGFTRISMYPMLWIRQGYSLESLMDELIRLGLER
ncbi:MAG: D-alanine--D-alanine ligase [Lachnospiraceae bacterium]|nr:D-alanine--D-alanine ligase [Lachnospiraceae bacterium]